MSRPHRVRRLVVTALLAGGCAAVVAAPGARAQAPAPTITASGLGESKPAPANRRSDVSIRKAVADANAKALPLAIANARKNAAAIATAAGLTLGTLQSISDGAGAAVPYFAFPQNGTFGNGHYCGKVRNTKTVVESNGLRRRVPTKGSHRTCRVPSEVYATATLVFSTT